VRRALVALVALAGCSDAPVAQGRQLVAERGCAGCHQSAARGDGVLSGQATPQPGTLAYPANLTPDRATGLGGWADIAIVRAVRFGVDDEQLPLCAPMPRFDGSDPARPWLSDGEADALVAYLRSLPPVRRDDIPPSRCPEREPPPDGGAP
jgi:mono/diheme cytochrome c family protein